MTKNDASLPLWDIIVAHVLLTRLPLPTAPKSAFDRQAKAVWAFALVGAVVGSIAMAIGWGAMSIGLPAATAAGLVLAVPMLMTGAMHEDGLADCADGFWGGFDPARRLEIMKDSQIGTYGVLALGVVTGLRWLCYSALIASGAWLAIIATASLSRGIMPLLMVGLPHSRTNGLSHSVGRPSISTAALALAIGALIAALCLGVATILCITAALVTAASLAALAKAKIGGQTGDVLGAAQQLAETASLLTLVALIA